MSFEMLKANLVRYRLREPIELDGFRGNNKFTTVYLTPEELSRLIQIVEESFYLYDAAKARFQEWNAESYKNLEESLNRFRELCEK